MASRRVWRASRGSVGISAIAAERRSGAAMAVLASRLHALPSRRSARAAVTGSRSAGLASAIRACTWRDEPLASASSAAAMRRAAARSGSGLSSADRLRRAAAALWPPRSRARPAPRSRMAATSSSGPTDAAARCHARRSLSSSESVAAASAPWAARRSAGRAPPYIADRMSGCRNATVDPKTTSPAASAATAASVLTPRTDAARRRKAVSAVESAAARSRSIWVSTGKDRAWRAKRSSSRRLSGSGCRFAATPIS